MASYLSAAARAAQEAARNSDGTFGTQSHSVPGAPPTARTHDGFLAAFAELDRELERQGIAEPVRVRAIGGFALLDHGLRAEASYTTDIDTLTDPYPAAVQTAVRTVADRLGLEPHWLNNDAAGDDTEMALELMDAEFIARDYGYANLRLEVADLPTLTRSKAIAVDTDMLSGRARDWNDLLDLLRRQHIASYAAFCRAYPEISEWEYPETHRSLESWYATGERGTPDDDWDDIW